MRRNLSDLTRTDFDVLIVGGGITGACLAHDAAQRGLAVALVEKGDFGGATSAASSKLLHGGIRYLQTLQIHKVRESASERILFQRIAPHLVRWVPFLVPTYREFRKGRLLLGAGMTVYDLICAGHDRTLPERRRVPPRQVLEREAVARELPALGGSPALTGGHVFHELHMNSSERMTLAFIRTAAREGAAVANYAAVDEFLVTGSRVQGAVVRDVLTGDRFHVRASLTINAAGPWIPALNTLLRVGRLPRPITHYSKGAHIVTRQVTPTLALALPSTRRGASIVDRGGRHIFVIPWRGHSLIGTSDSPFDQDLDAVTPGEEDVEGLLRDVAAALPGAGLDRRDVRHAFAGLYPLTGTPQPNVYRGTGLYQVVDHGRHDGVEGFVSVVGAKYTTARRLAARAMQVVTRRLGRGTGPSRTGEVPLVGFVDDPDALAASLERTHRDRIEPGTARHLVAHYGAEAETLLRSEPAALARLAPDRESIEAEVTFAVQEEMAVRLDDVIFRRTGLGTIGHPGMACLRRCAELMAAGLGWSRERIEQEVAQVDARFLVRPPEEPAGR